MGVQNLKYNILCRFNRSKDTEWIPNIGDRSRDPGHTPSCVHRVGLISRGSRVTERISRDPLLTTFLLLP